MNRRRFLTSAAAGVAAAGLRAQAAPAPAAGKGGGKPNFVVIFIDDMGYGDIEPFGSKLNKTPHLSRMAAEGMKLTSFYVAAPVCTPSRAALMTGCYPLRVGLPMGSWHGVLFPGDKHGLHPKEVTVAKVLQSAGYATGCFGKWHLGDQPQFLPTSHGFDYYYGIPYSNDMWPGLKRWDFPRLPILRNTEVVGEVKDMADQGDLCRQFTEEAVGFIRKSSKAGKPFFVYLPHAFVHHPRAAGKKFVDRATNPDKVTGGQIEEVDWSVGRILQTLRELKRDKDTLVLFTSDNGGSRGCVNAPLRGGKGSTWEGGMREPTLAWWPGRVKAGSTCGELVTAMDVLPTLAKLAGADPPADRILDGKDISPLLLGAPGAKTPHEAFYYYARANLQAVRSGKWKLHVQGPRLYDLDQDVGEKTDRAKDHPEVVRRLQALLAKARADLGDGAKRGANCRPVGVASDPRTILPRPGKTGPAAHAPGRPAPQPPRTKK